MAGKRAEQNGRVRVNRCLRAVTLGMAVLAGALARPATARAEDTVVSISAFDDAESLRARIPVSGAFTLEYEFDSEVAEATLDVWPETLKSCDGKPPGRGTRQTYSLKLKLATESGKTKGTALVPHLQVAEHFCFKVAFVKKVPPDPTDLDAAIAANGKVIATPEEARHLALALLAATANGFCSLPSQPAGGAVCAPIDVTPLEYPLLEAVVQAHVADQQFQKLAQSYEAADSQLSEHKALGRSFKPPAALEDKVPSAVWVDRGVTHATIEAARAVVLANANDLKGSADAMRRWLDEAEARLALVERLDAAKREAATNSAASRVSGLAKQRDVAYAFLKDNLRANHTADGLKVRGKTSDFDNYISPELGIAVAHPFVKGGSFTLVPYTAVNIYFKPVDRELALSEVVKPFYQRFSLTLGLSLSQELEADEVDFSPTVAGTFGILGAGLRVLPFARVAGLLMFAKASPRGGLSTQSKLVAAGALAISADVDVVTLIGNSLTKN